MKIIHVSWLPGACQAFAFNPVIVVRKNYNFTDAILAHETVHIERQKAYGTVKWICKYLTNAQFRLDEEIVAIQKEFEVGKPENPYNSAWNKALDLQEFYGIKADTADLTRLILKVNTD